MTHIRVSKETRDLFVGMATEAGISTGQLLVNLLQELNEQQERLVQLEGQPQFPLNEAGDYSQIWGYPLVVWRNGALYICQHGYPLILHTDAHIAWLSPGHECEFKPRSVLRPE